MHYSAEKGSFMNLPLLLVSALITACVTPLALAEEALGSRADRDRVRPGEDGLGVEGVRYQSRWNEPRRHLSQRFRRGGAQPRHRRADQFAVEQEPSRTQAGVGEDLKLRFKRLIGDGTALIQPSSQRE